MFFSTADVIELGLLLPQSVFSPDLKTGVTLESFNSSGKIPVRISLYRVYKKKWTLSIQISYNVL
jgi:hypothetical protein